MAKDPQIELHKQWLGFLQPQGLVVAPAALVDCQAFLNQNVVAEQQRLLSSLVNKPVTEAESKPGLSLTQLCTDLLGWDKADLIPGTATGIESTLTDYHETLRPDFAVRDPEPQDPKTPWSLLIRELPHGTDPDADAEIEDNRNWRASHQARFERLLRESQIPTGLLHFGTGLRLVYAPKGESSGALTFPFAAMTEVSGRPILSALILLLGRDRLFTFGRAQRLPALLEKSRKYQNQVSTALAEQVLAALHELLRGCQSAHAHSGERLLKGWLRDNPDDIYGGLLTVILRLIFLLYAEDRGLLGNDEAWQSGYSVLGLFERLRSDADRFPDTLDHRFGAWAQLLATFRLVFDGAKHGQLQLPPRHGYLFHPDGGDGTHYQFLEGRPYGIARQVDEVLTPPRISDRVVWEVLNNLMVLDGERISYRTLNVEQIGSVYETMMGFRFEVTKGPSLAIKPQKAHGAATVVNLLELLDVPGAKRAAWLKENADCKLVGKGEEAITSAASPEEVALALGKKVSKLTPAVLPAGSFVLQPSDARRKSGSHYTPPQLTQPIVLTTLRPVLEQLGERPTAEQVLELKVCDPAMGSGAFLVEACRQLGAAVVKGWANHPGTKPVIPPDEDDLLFAKRLVATRCLYGVDKNPFAVALAKLSLWLETFAKEHAFTFVDHALRCGDSLIGLGREQIAAFHWDVMKRGAFVETVLKRKMKEVEAIRAKILGAGESTKEGVLRRWLRDADEAVGDLRLIGDLVVAAFFGETKDKDRMAKRADLAGKVDAWLRAGGQASKEKEELRREVAELRAGAKGVEPFHWEVEFPEVFTRGGFNAFVGNPPFAGVTELGESLGPNYGDWLREQTPGAAGKCDLVAFFLRRVYSLLRNHGTLGLLTTKTIYQGDTRRSGLALILREQGQVYSARRRIPWPGQAAVIVAAIHLSRDLRLPSSLDGYPCGRISAFLLPDIDIDDPHVLAASRGRAFLGAKLQGQGFLFDDGKPGCPAPSVADDLIRTGTVDASHIRHYLGGDELNAMSRPGGIRRVLDLGDLEAAEVHANAALEAHLRRWVIPSRSAGSAARDYWRFGHRALDLFLATKDLSCFLVVAASSDTFAIVRVSNNNLLVNNKVIAFPTESLATFSILQSRVHEVWARTFCSTIKDDFQYAPSDGTETFPFSEDETAASMQLAGDRYHEFRATLMVRNDEGLTKTYNRFHDPDEQSPDIKKLRELHAAMDRAVLDAYGWTDLKPTHEFLLDYEEEDDDEDTGRTRKRKKPWRYRWPDDFRDEVLMRLLRLNQDRADQERLQTPPPTPKATGKKRGHPRKGDATPSLFGKDDT